MTADLLSGCVDRTRTSLPGTGARRPWWGWRDIEFRAPLDPVRRRPYGVARLIYQSLAQSHDRRDSGMVVQVDGALQAPAVPDQVLNRSLADTDPAVFDAISAELTRQQTTLEMIASENFAPVRSEEHTSELQSRQ